MKERIGIYAGTFDPVHQGHLAFAQSAAEQCNLDRVVFLPERAPRGKRDVTEFVHRLRLLEIATREMSQAEVLALDSPQFSVAETLPVLQRHYTGSKLVFLLGSDVVRSSLANWPDLHVLLSMAELAVGLREGDTREAVDTMLQGISVQQNMPVQYAYIESEHADVSSSRIRNGFGEHTHTAVTQYIQDHGLYR